MTLLSKWRPQARVLALAVAAALLAACVAPKDDLTNSRLTQPPPGAPVPPPAEAGDIAVAGQIAAHAIMDLPEVANAPTPPMVQFTGVTSIIVGPVPIDTEPYTTLLRDRLLLITREKLRFVERELPPLVIAPPKKSKKKKAAPAPVPETPENPDYEVLAELHGRAKDKFYKVQIQFIDIHTGAVLFNGLYRIGKEMPPGDDTAPPSSDAAAPSAPPSDTAAPPSDPGAAAPPPPPPVDSVPATPTVQDPGQSSTPGMTQ